jgi:DNA-binding beta-propeller fold protein YncE
MALTALAATASAVAGAQAILTVIPFTAPTQGISVDPVRNKIYVVAPDPTGLIFNLAVIDGSTNTVTSTIPLTSGASYPAVDYLANRIYVTGCNGQVTPADCIVTVIDGNTDRVVTTIPISTTLGGGLTGITVNPLSGLVYVANADDNVIDVINGRKAKLVSSISLNGNSPSAIAMNPILNLLYVPYGTNQTAVVDAWTKRIVTTTTFGTSTVGAAVNVVTGSVFVTDQEFSGPSLTGVLSANGHLVTSVTVGDNSVGVDVDPFTDLAFVASPLLEKIDVIKGSNNTLQATVSGVQGQYVAVNPATRMVYASGQIGVTVLSEN